MWGGGEGGGSDRRENHMNMCLSVILIFSFYEKKFQH